MGPTYQPSVIAQRLRLLLVVIEEERDLQDQP
jgi:hypothetical protein